MSIKNFSILARLGQGAYSSVYKVKRSVDGTEYALKKVKLGGLNEKELQNALNQVRILASIHHKNIVSYKQAFLQGKSLCIIMQFADDGDLYQKIIQNRKKNQYFEENKIWSVLIQITKGLKKLHDLKILHRDMKSANVFLTKEGCSKLGDLNVSKIAQNGLLYTQTGTPYYASPEVWLDQPYDVKSDIWSFGVVMYEMASLSVPFQASDMQQLGKVVTSGKYNPIPSHYSSELSNAIRMMLQLKPNNRPSTNRMLKSSIFYKKAAQLQIQMTGSKDYVEKQLLQTIYMPKKLHYLTDRLPKPNYERKKTHEPYHLRQHTHNQRQNIRSNLPKIESILRYHEKSAQQHHYHRNDHQHINGYDLNRLNGKKIYSIVSENRPSFNEPIKRIPNSHEKINNHSYKKYERGVNNKYVMHSPII